MMAPWARVTRLCRQAEQWPGLSRQATQGPLVRGCAEQGYQLRGMAVRLGHGDDVSVPRAHGGHVVLVVTCSRTAARAHLRGHRIAVCGRVDRGGRPCVRIALHLPSNAVAGVHASVTCSGPASRRTIRGPRIDDGERCRALASAALRAVRGMRHACDANCFGWRRRRGQLDRHVHQSTRCRARGIVCVALCTGMDPVDGCAGACAKLQRDALRLRHALCDNKRAVADAVVYCTHSRGRRLGGRRVRGRHIGGGVRRRPTARLLG